MLGEKNVHLINPTGYWLQYHLWLSYSIKIKLYSSIAVVIKEHYHIIDKTTTHRVLIIPTA